MTCIRPLMIIEVILSLVFLPWSGVLVALGQTTPGQSPTTNPAPAKKKKPSPPTPARTPTKRSSGGTTKPAPNNDAAEITFWESIKDSKNAADFQAYLRKYGEKGKFSDLAHNRLTEMETANKPAETKPPATVSNPGGPGTAPATTQPAKPAAGAPWRSPQGIDFVYVPSGSFVMGQGNGENDVKPVHKVTISQGFYLGKTEVTQTQWLAVMGSNPSSHKGDDLPVERVSWDDVQEFIRKLNDKNSGTVYRLPTEAEWEYACRAGTSGSYPGDLDSMAWYDHTSGNETHRVGTKQPNAWGLFDMQGNVWEWVQDWYGSYSEGAQIDPGGPNSGSKRVVRGGSFNLPNVAQRSNYRDGDTPDFDYPLNGFRLAMSIKDTASDESGGQPVAGTPWRSPQGIDFVYVPSGSFDMGSVDGAADEEPVHRVTISQGFYLGKTEVTQAQWKAVMGSNPSYKKGDDLPVEDVSWNDVQEFIRRLNAQGGATYRLPSEAEWEYAARAGTIGPPSTDLDVFAWNRANSDSKSHPVGQKRPNGWGLYDMHGNVYEWVQDWYATYSDRAQTDPTGPSSGEGRVYRGGGYMDNPTGLRSTYRVRYPPGERFVFLGFRLARTF